jgi:hypothetical protein
MGTDPKTFVVNAWHQTHDVKNLFLVDGSSYTTSAAVNPTSTIGYRRTGVALCGWHLGAAQGFWSLEFGL